MNDKNHYIVMMIVYIFMGAFLMLYTTPWAVVFVMIVLLAYHALSYLNFKLEVYDQQEKERKQLRYELEKTQKRKSEASGQFMKLLEVIDSGLILIDEQEIIKQVNDTFINFFGIPSPIDQPYEILKPIRGLYKSVNEAFISELRFREQISFNQRIFDVNISPIFEKKMYKGCLVVVHDITQLKTAETFQKQFTADVSHELKTPLSAIKGISEILMRNTSMNASERDDFIKLIYQESTRLETILNDLLIISKMDRIDYELNVDRVQIKSLIEEVINLLLPQAKEKQLDLRYQLDEAEMMVDGIKIKQVMINLVKNAISYTDQGSVTITGVNNQEEYIIEVSDTGIGIAEEEQESVFKRFYRVDEARSRASGGSGLGLSIIKNVVKKHHGDITLKSEPGNGSTFTVRLPIIVETN